MNPRTFVRKGLAMALVAALGVTACDEETVIPPPAPPAPTIQVTPQAITLQQGETAVVSASVGNVENPQITWASSNSSVASVSGSGAQATITAAGRGSATITATVAGQPSLVASAQVTVTAPPPGPDVTISITPNAASVNVGQSVQLVAAVGGTTNTGVTWSSVDQNVATVNASGRVTGVAPGTAVIVATSQADPSKTATATISVNAPPPVSVSVVPSSASLQVGATLNLTAVVSGSSNTNVTWTSSDANVATVSAAGVVTAVSSGTVVISATSAADPTAVGTATITVAPIGMTISPASADIIVGDQVQFTANVTGTSNRAVTWTSSNTNVLTISTTGLATAVATGNAIVTATSAADPNVSASATVNVTQPQGNTSVGTITFTNAAGQQQPINPAAVAGVITATVNVDAPVGSGVQTVQLVLDCANGGSMVVGTQNVTAGTTGQVQFTFNTAAFNPATGAPNFLNGSCTLRSELLGAGGNVIAAGQNVNMTLANANALVMTATAPNSAINPNTGLTWADGTVTVTVLPVIYVPGTTIASVSVTANTAAGGAIGTLTATSGPPFTLTFNEANVAGFDLAGIMDPALVFTATSLTAAGNPGPAVAFAAAAPVNGHGRYDNAAPIIPAGGLDFSAAAAAGAAAFWINGSFVFNATNTGLTGADAVTDALAVPAGATGVNAVTCTWFAGPNTAGLVQVSTGADLAETLTNTALIVRVTCVDLLGNSATQTTNAAGGSGVTIGVDKTAPTQNLTAASVVNQQIFNNVNPVAGNNLVVAFTDASTDPNAAPSGFGATPVWVTLTVSAPGLTTAQSCLNPTTPNTLGSGTIAGGVCQPVATNGTLAMPTTLAGYFTYTFFTRDLAGNATAVQTVTVLVDDDGAVSLPTASNIGIPATLTGGQSATFTVQLTDNIDLRSAEFNFVFGAADVVPGPGAASRLPVETDFVGTAFDGVLTATATADATHPYVRGVQLGVGGGITNTSAVQFDIFDAAFNFNTRTDPVAGPASNGVALGAGNTWTMTDPATNVDVCDAVGSCPAGDVQSTTVQATVTGPTAVFTNPFARVYFFAFDANSGQTVFIGQAGAPSVTDNGATRTWFFTQTFNAGALGLTSSAANQGTASGGTFEIFAVGMDTAGDFIVTANGTTQIDITT